MLPFVCGSVKWRLLRDAGRFEAAPFAQRPTAEAQRCESGPLMASHVDRPTAASTPSKRAKRLDPRDSGFGVRVSGVRFAEARQKRSKGVGPRVSEMFPAPILRNADLLILGKRKAQNFQPWIRLGPWGFGLRVSGQGLGFWSLSHKMY